MRKCLSRLTVTLLNSLCLFTNGYLYDIFYTVTNKESHLRQSRRNNSRIKQRKLQLQADPDLNKEITPSEEVSDVLKYFHTKRFTNEKELLERFTSYLHWAKKYHKPLTLERCSCFLGIDHHTLRSYKKDQLLAPTVNQIVKIILSNKVESLTNKFMFTPGIIFDLKNNHMWTDRSEVKMEGEITFIGKIKEAIKKSKELNNGSTSSSGSKSD